MPSFITNSLSTSLSDRYIVERELGRGGMAAVYLATDKRHDRKVAIKVLDSNVAGSLGVDRFLREIQIAARLTHPHIVPLYDSGETAGAVFFVMPYIAGESLRDRITREGPMPLRTVARIASDVAGALDYAHRQGVIHRDIKPDNVMFTDGHAVVADFGIARAIAEATDGTLTIAGTVVGTPAYMSPEQGTGGEAPLDGRCDQYALACVVFEMLTGVPPFTGPSALAMMVQHMTASPPRLTTPERVPLVAEQAIRRALAKLPSERFATVGEFAEALDNADTATRQETAQLPQATLPVAGPRLPVPLTPLVGRDHDVQTISALLRQPVRLLTLYGSGGIGKTRLAVEVASRTADLFPDGVWFVALAEVRDADSMIARIGQALGLRGASTPGQAVRDHLRDRDALLVLDNFEQLAEAGATEVAALLGDCPRLKVLITSQSLLRVYGEHEFRVDPLPLPDPRQSHGDLAALQESPAVRLFLQRATAARPDFALDANNAAAIAEICQRLDGVPLAIELAAARVRNTSPQVLLPKLRDTLAVLTGGARDVPERQRTMRNAIAWTHGLLSEPERVLFRRLAVLAAGVTTDSAAGICGDDDTIDAGELLNGLADRSLLRPQVDAVGEPRYAMLRPVLAFAAEMLDQAGERADVADRHAVYFRALAMEAEPHVQSGDDEWLDRLESDHDNLRAALAHLVERGLIADAIRTGVALWRYWEVRSYGREGVDQLGAALQLATSDLPASLRLTGLFAAGILADSCGDYERGRQYFKQHLALTEQGGDAAATSIARNNLGILMLRQGDVDGAIPLFEAASQAMRDVPNPQAMALGIANIGNAEKMRGNFVSARARYDEARDVFVRIGDRVNVAWSQSHLGDLARDEGNATEAREHYREGLAIFVSLAHKRGMASMLTDLGELVASQGDLLEARGLLEEALINVADLGDQRAMLRVFEVLAGVASAQLQDERAVCIAGAVAGLRDRLGAPLSDTDRNRLQGRVAASVVRLDAATRDRVWRNGLGMPIDEVIRFVTAPGPERTI